MTAPRIGQAGVGLLEAMIAALLLAIGLLGLGQLLSRQLAELRSGNHRALALQHIESLQESLALNAVAARAGHYSLGWNESRHSALDCRSRACDASQLADHDLDLWGRSLRAAIPQAQATVFAVPGTTTIGIAVAWPANERPMDAVDAAVQAALTDASLVATHGGIECPPTFVCQFAHVQP